MGQPRPTSFVGLDASFVSGVIGLLAARPGSLFPVVFFDFFPFRDYHFGLPSLRISPEGDERTT